MTTEKVLQALISEGKALKAAEIAEKTGIDKKDVDKALKDLKASGKVIVPKVCFYQAK